MSSLAFSQQALEKSLDSLKSLKETYQKKITAINIECARIENLIAEQKFDESQGEPFYTIFSTGLYVNADGTNLLTTLKKDTKMKVMGQKGDYYDVSCNGLTGWVRKVFVASETEYNAKKKASMQATKNQIANRKSELVKKYGETNAQRIIDKKIWIGMTDKMARESWGEPKDINRTVGTFGVHEQWVYYGDGNYLYFEDGILTTWQD